MGRWKKPYGQRVPAACPDRKPAPPGRLNVYRCTCGWELVTIDIHDGVTWMLEKCQKCGGQATSCFYSEKATAGKTPTHEFYMPMPDEFAKLHPAEREHCAKGGLLLRKRVQLETTP